MNRYDKEDRIIKLAQGFKVRDIKFFPITLKSINLYFKIKLKSKWKFWTNSSSKSDAPPDFYSDKYKLMMEVMRIDDHARINEKGKIVNLNNKRESKILKGVIEKNPEFKKIFDEGRIFINPYSGLKGDKDHNYNFYIENFSRVIKKHILKIKEYKKNHPKFKLIFFIFDESSAYIQDIHNKARNVKFGESFMAEPHFWWKDLNMIKVFENVEIDYIIWATPYKNFDKRNYRYPNLTIIDVKKLTKIRKKIYDKKIMQSMERWPDDCFKNNQ